MHLLDLPAEILGDIIKLLDTKSKMHLWEAECERLRDAMLRRDVMRHVTMSRCSLHFADLEPWLSSTIADYIVELDLSGRRDAPADKLAAAVRRLPNLRALDVSYTGISMFEACDVLEACPHLTRIAVRFDWPSVPEHLLPYGEEYCRNLVRRCQHAFRNLEAIHFVGDYFVAIECIHPFHLLQHCANLKELQLTLHEDSVNLSHHMDCMAPAGPRLMTFSLRIHNVMYFGDNNFLSYPLMQWFNLDNWQIVVVKNACSNPQVLMTEKLYKEAIKMSDGKMYSLLDVHAPLAIVRPTHIHMWHVELEELNPNLYTTIVAEINHRLPRKVCKKTIGSVYPRAEKYLMSTCACECFDVPMQLPPHGSNAAKRASTTLKTAKLNLDSLVVGERRLKVSLQRSTCACSDPLSFPTLRFDPDSSKLKNITLLNISQFLLDLSSFKCLFQVCRRLETLALNNILEDSGYLAETVHLAESIKFIMLTSRNINIDQLIKSVAMCPTLQSICITDRTNMTKRMPTRETYRTILTKCRNLCDLFILIDLPRRERKLIYFEIKEVLAEMSRPQYVNIKIERQPFYSDYDPLFDVLVNDIELYVNKKLSLK